MGGLANVGGLPVDRAVSTFTVLAAEEFDVAPGTVPAGARDPARAAVPRVRRAQRRARPALSAEEDVRAGEPVPSYKQPGMSA